MNKTTDHFKRTIQAYLEQRAAEDKLFAASYSKPNKNIDECVTYLLHWAKSQCDGGNAIGMTGGEVISQAVHYFDEDDIDIGKPIPCQVMVCGVELTDEEKAELKRLCDEVENFYRAGKNHTKKDQAFHAAIAKASGNSVVESLMPTIHTAIITFVNLTYHKLMEETIQTHRAVTEAIVQGDSVGAKCAMIMHLTYNRQMLVKMMQERKAGNKTDDNKE